MTDTSLSNKSKKTQKSLDEEIAAAEERLKRLKQRKAEKEQKELERNQKLVYAFLRTEKLDAVPIEIWSKTLAQLRKLLKTDTEKDAVKVETEVPRSTKGAAGQPAGDGGRKADIGPAEPGPKAVAEREESAAA